MRTTTNINEEWNEYDQTIAKTHISNYGIIFLDEKYGLPIDDLFELEELYMAYMSKENGKA